MEFKFDFLEEKLKFMKICLIHLELSNSFIDFYACLTNAICSIQNIFAIRQSYLQEKRTKNQSTLSFLSGNTSNLIDLNETISSPSSPILSITSNFRKSIFEQEIEDLKYLEPHPRLKLEKTKINTELVEPTNPMDLGLISSLKNVQVQIKKLNEKGLIYLMNQKNMKMNEFMDNYLSINSNLFDVFFEILKILPKESEDHLEEFLKIRSRSRSEPVSDLGLLKQGFLKIK